MSKSQDFVGLTNFDLEKFSDDTRASQDFFLFIHTHTVHRTFIMSYLSLKRPCALHWSDKSRCRVKSLVLGCNKSCDKCWVPEVVRWAREQWNEFLWLSQVDSLTAVWPSPNYSELDYNSKLMKAGQLFKWENLIFVSKLMLQMTDPDKENI